jgi:predicted regulator of Ras-like GTPase activity (Roadblock/LC7/MglB family)
MQAEHEPEISTDEMPALLEEARQAMDAQLVLATNSSGVICASARAADFKSAPVTLAALSAAHLSSGREILRGANLGADATKPQTFLIEGTAGAVLVGGSENGFLFTIVLGPGGMVGLARLELRRLTRIRWVDPAPPVSLPDLGELEQFLHSLDTDL